ncbi:MAG: Flp pilus assembly complex ATPase component TadA [Alphaproteobacteria bacterium]|nr:Flp pilus assembly complex ATPase component TadA [Alphaproteobacteria bacterium]
MDPLDRKEEQVGIAEPWLSREPPPIGGAWLAPDEIAPQPIGELLIASGLIGENDVARALAFQERYGGRLGSILVRLGALSEERLLPVLSAQLNLPLLGEDDLPGDISRHMEAVQASGYPVEWWIDQEALPWFAADHAAGELWVVAKDPLQNDLQEFVSASFGDIAVQWALIATQILDRALDRLQQHVARDGHSFSDEVSHLRELAEEAPVIEQVNTLIAQAFEELASDIHVEPAERDFRVRFRIDGVLQTRLTLPRDRFDAVASRIKLVSGLDIAERRLPQDGRLAVRLSGEMVDIRVSSLPSTWGESLVLRLLPKERKQFQLERLGMASPDLTQFRYWIREPHGIILITGPTGSGKSTTLYATLEEINDGSTKIVTVEEPVEYSVKGISQVQAQPDIGYTFARALRAILRQDPDKIMIGEIRDLETAQIAVQAALTGHMVFSTLHTNDSLSAFTRLVDMGVEPFLVASAVRLVMAQRLARRLCEHCAEPDHPAGEVEQQIAALRREAPGLFEGRPRWRRPVGCRECFGLGFKGRLGLYEMVSITPELHEAILKRLSAQEMRELVRPRGARTLREDGIAKAWRAETSLDEVFRVTGGAIGL